MAICGSCGQEMTAESTISCTADPVIEFPDGVVMAAVPYHNEHMSGYHRCHDCNVEVGGYHHPGCDMEVCPRCGGQLISCGHLDEDNEGEEDEHEYRFSLS